jgi:hypothetical protein
MKRASVFLAIAVSLVGSTAAWALTVLEPITPQNIKGSTFTLTSKAVRTETVEFLIRRNVRGIDWPSRKAYLSDPTTDPKTLGTPIKLEQDGKTFTFRFSVPAEKVEDSVFTLWGGPGEQVTFRFRLGEFWKPDDKS